MISRRRALALALLALALVFGAYANSLSSPFHFDDFHSVEDNVWLRSLSHIPRYFTDVSVFSPLQENRAYRPILLVGFAVSHAIAGGSLWGYHVVTLVLHAFGAWFVGLLALRVMRANGTTDSIALGAAVFATALFAVHTLLSEPANYISSRSSLQAAVLSFGSVLAYVKAREDVRPRWFWIAALLLLLAMGTKIIAMTVPALCLGWELWLGPSRERSLRERISPLAPLFVIALGFTVFHELFVSDSSRASRSNIAPWSYFLTETQVWLRYLGLFVWPEDLNADATMRWSQSIYEGPVARALLMNGLIVIGALFCARRRPAITFGVFWYYVALAPTNSFAPLSEPASEHRVYIAVPGLVFALCGLIAWAIEAAYLRRRLAIALAAVLIVVLGVRTHFRNRVWQSDLSLWADVVTRSPDNGRAHLNYGLAQMSRGDLAGARLSFDRCAAAWPGYSFCYINRAALALHEKRQLDAEHEIALAEQLAPNNVYVTLWRGEIERSAERWDRAEAAYRRTLEISPGHENAMRGLAVSLFMLSRLEEARPLLLQLDAANSLDADGHYALGYLADVGGDAKEAIRHYQASLARKPDHLRSRYNLGVALQRAGDLPGAIREYRVLAQSQTPLPDALFNLAIALWQSGDQAGARSTKEVLSRQAPDYPGLAQLSF